MNLRRIFVTAAMAAVLAMPMSSFALPQDKDDKHEEKREGHPVIHEAIRQLEHTKDELEHKAAKDFHGHKALAIKSINEAIAHLNEALASDKE